MGRGYHSLFSFQKMYSKILTLIFTNSKNFFKEQTQKVPPQNTYNSQNGGLDKLLLIQ